MNGYTKQDIIGKVKEKGVEFIRLQFTDIFGQLKNVVITSYQLEKALNNEMMFDGSSIEGFVRIEESDMYLFPDLSTFMILPWNPQQGKVARLICDIHKSDGTPFEGDPRYVLKRALKEAEELGYQFEVGPECEFFLFNTDAQGRATTQTNDQGGYFDLAPIDNGDNARREMCLMLDEMGYEIEASHHEVSAGQHEIDFKYGDALSIADKIMMFKLIVKTVAKRHGLYASFMPKPIFAVSGSGMHINQSLSKNGKNAFYEESDPLGLSTEAYSYIAGLLKHIESMTSITNPLVNSYKRLVPGYEAPCYVAWSAQNRSPLIRIPATRGAGTRVELRCPDPCANPYLALAACLSSGLDGIKNKLQVPPSVDKNIYALDNDELEALGVASLPVNLGKAIAYTKKDPFMKKVLGEHIHTQYVKAKEAEYADYRMQVTQWELDRYLSIY